MGVPYYPHFYSNDMLIVAFLDRVFHAEYNKETWKPVIDCDLSMGIPKNLLDFFPNCFEDGYF